MFIIACLHSDSLPSLPGSALHGSWGGGDPCKLCSPNFPAKWLLRKSDQCWQKAKGQEEGKSQSTLPYPCFEQHLQLECSSSMVWIPLFWLSSESPSPPHCSQTLVNPTWPSLSLQPQGGSQLPAVALLWVIWLSPFVRTAFPMSLSVIPWIKFPLFCYPWGFYFPSWHRSGEHAITGEGDGELEEGPRPADSLSPSLQMNHCQIRPLALVTALDFHFGRCLAGNNFWLPEGKKSP